MIRFYAQGRKTKPIEYEEEYDIDMIRKWIKRYSPVYKEWAKKSQSDF